MKKRYLPLRVREITLDTTNCLLAVSQQGLDDVVDGGDETGEDEAGTKYTNSIWCWPTSDI